ncbi:MAG: CAP and S-layer homology domain-containing protein [Thermoleophilia bacterium]
MSNRMGTSAVRRAREAAVLRRPTARVAVIERASEARLLHFAQWIAVGVFLVLAVLLLQTASASAAVSYDSEELAFLRLINEHRVAAGRPALLLSDQLSATAERHGTDMGTYDFFSHTTLSSARYPVGSEFWQRLEYDGYAGAGTSGENLAAGVDTASEVFELWKNSAGHNENMLDPVVQGSRVTYKEIGIARIFASGSTYGWYWVTEFGGVLDATAHDPFTTGASAGPFIDVSTAHPYVEAIKELSEAKVVNGYDDGTFRPQNPVWRQHFAKMIVSTLGLPVSEADRAEFSDVDDYGLTTLYPDNYIAVAASTGITRGTGNGQFSPAADISRAQVVSMIVRALQSLRPGTLAVPPAGYAATWRDFSTDHEANARLAEYNGLLAGMPLAGLDPWGKMTRGEVAQVLFNLHALLDGR